MHDNVHNRRFIFKAIENMRCSTKGRQLSFEVFDQPVTTPQCFIFFYSLVSLSWNGLIKTWSLYVYTYQSYWYTWPHRKTRNFPVFYFVGTKACLKISMKAKWTKPVSYSIKIKIFSCNQLKWVALFTSKIGSKHSQPRGQCLACPSLQSDIFWAWLLGSGCSCSPKKARSMAEARLSRLRGCCLNKPLQAAGPCQ